MCLVVVWLCLVVFSCALYLVFEFLSFCVSSLSLTPFIFMFIFLIHHLLHKTGVQQIYGVIYDNKQSGVLSPQNILPGGVSSPVDIERGRHPGWVSVVRCLIVFMVHCSARER